MEFAWHANQDSAAGAVHPLRKLRKAIIRNRKAAIIHRINAVDH